MFNAKRFMQAKFQDRTKDISVPELRHWCDALAHEELSVGPSPEPPPDPVWRVRGINANELAKARDAKTKNQNIVALATALTQGSHDDKVREIRSAVGYSDDVHHEVAYRLELLSIGSVEPKCPLDLAVQLSERFPVTFWELSSAVLELTGQGQESAEKKPKHSGKIQKSAPASG